MSKVLGFLHKLEWGNPYVSPPGGVKVMMEVFIPANDEGCRVWPKEMEELYWKLRPIHQNGLYGHTIRAITEFPREMCQDTLRTIRRKRLKRRMEDKYPLFVEQFTAEELRRKGEYYDGITDERFVRARKEVKEEHEQLLERFGVRR